ncbi:MAG TPA: HAD family hydrolase [Chthonomonadaceae bacterium]|nr:HAD family hydrolase [Chthonomonadaceae bacterium]
MPDGKTVFLDFDDTLNDPFVLLGQYSDCIGARFAPHYGSTPRDWAKASIDTLIALEREYLDRFTGNPRNGYCAWLASVQERSIAQIFGRMGLPTPPNALELARTTQFEALSECDAAFPGAQQALAALTEAGYHLHMASGQESEYLRAALIGAKLDAFPERLYGPDLIDCAKEGPEYYERLFADIGVRPQDALIVDDQPTVIAWALQVGATVLQSHLSPERHYPAVPGIAASLTDLHTLPQLVDLHHPLR